MSQCAKDCLDQAASENGCDVSDTFCVCTHQDVVADAVDCALNSCSAQDVSTVAGLFESKCESLAASGSLSSDRSTTTRPTPISSLTSSFISSKTSSSLTSPTATSTKSSLTQVTRTTASSSHPSTPSISASSSTTSTNATFMTSLAATSVFSHISGSPPPVTWSSSAIPTVTLIATLHPPTPTSPLSATGNRLSTGAVAGIAVGASAATAICLVLLALWYVKHRRRGVPTPYTDPFTGSPLSYPHRDRNRSVLWIFEEGGTQMDGASLMARGSCAVSNGSDIAPPPPYARWTPNNGTAVSEKPSWETSQGEGPSLQVEAPTITSYGVEHRGYPTYRIFRRALSPAGGMFGQGYGADGSDQRSTSDRSTLPPSYSHRSSF